MDYCSIPQSTYRAFSEHIHNKVVKNRVPLKGAIELTMRCNLHCVHCYCIHDPLQKEMDLKEICRVLDELADAGCLWLLLTGGEPLLREDFLDIYAYAKKKGMIITLFTNGTLITPQIADYLREYPPFAIEISLYGAVTQTYEKITEVPGSFQRCLQGIGLLAERKLFLRLKTMAMTLNQDEVLEMEKFAQRSGFEFRFDAAINPRLDGSKEPCAYRLSPEKIIGFDLVSEKRISEWKLFCQKFWGPADPDKLYVCGAGINSFHVDPYGYLSVCEMARNPHFNLRQGSFKEYWHTVIPQVTSQKPQGYYQCGHCDMISLCSQCPGWSQLENGNLQEPVKYLCQIAKLRAEAFAPKQVPEVH